MVTTKVSPVPKIKPTSPATSSTIPSEGTPHVESPLGTTISKTIQDELNLITEYTAKTNNEAEITICHRPSDNPDKYFIAGHDEGDENSVKLKPCNRKFGKSTQIGVVHTHPYNSNVIGITPSDADLTNTLEDSFDNN